MQWRWNPVKVVEEVDRIKQRLSLQSERIERVTGDELKEEKATIRNIIMQLEGLKLLLRRRRQ
jgi:hypothetical protein